MSPAVDPPADRLAERPAWQVVALAVAIVVGTLFTIIAVVAVGTVTAPVSPLAGRVHLALVGLPVVLGLYEAARRWLFGAPAAWFLAARPGPRVLGWVAVGLGFPAAVLGLQLWVLGATAASGVPTASAVAGALAASVVVGLLPGVLEELALRGALLRVLEARWGSRVAIWATAAVFAGLHQGHAGGPVGLGLVLASMLAAGLLLGVVVVRTRSVWNAVALHAGWNAVFGGTLVTAGGPGAALEPALVQFRLPTAEPVLTGGAATLGAAPLTTGCLLLAAVAVARSPGSWLGRDGRAAGPSPARER